MTRNGKGRGERPAFCFTHCAFSVVHFLYFVFLLRITTNPTSPDPNNQRAPGMGTGVEGVKVANIKGAPYIIKPASALHTAELLMLLATR